MEVVFFFKIPPLKMRLSKVEQQLQGSAYKGNPPFGFMMLRQERGFAEEQAGTSYKVHVNAHCSEIAKVLETLIYTYLSNALNGTARFYSPGETELSQLVCRGIKPALKRPIKDIANLLIEANQPPSGNYCEMPFHVQSPQLTPKQVRAVFSCFTRIDSVPVVRKPSSGFLLADRGGRDYAMSWFSNGWQIADWTGAKHPRAWSSTPNSATYSVELMLQTLFGLAPGIGFICETYELEGTVIRKRFMTSIGVVEWHSRREKDEVTEVVVDLPTEDGFRYYRRGLDSMNVDEYSLVKSLIF